jgi:hypothetical protein
MKLKFAGAVAITCLLLLSEGWPQDASYSKRVQKILADARAALVAASDARTLTIEPTSTLGLSQDAQGDTAYYFFRIVITVHFRTAPEYDDALVAHELTHVILNSRKFVGGAQPSPQSKTLVPGDRELLKTDATRLISCFPDELIDRETTARGFKPALINDMTEGFRKLADAQPNLDEGYSDILKRLQAMLNFCVLKRMSNADRVKFKSLIATKMGPSVSKYTQDLITEFGDKRCVITDPSGCYQLTRQLRHAAGLDAVFNLCTPNSFYSPWNCDT